ncbi:MAG: hypothetical protein LH650_15125 [Chloroflexi bacterium]|nr:hypothetical protein [Chloroflexota bacterium]
MIHRPRAITALLVALSLLAAMPAAAIQAADPTPLDTNILVNSGFETAGTDGAIPGWTVEGDVHVETFGTRAWPYPAYGRKWGGGKRYLTCGKQSGLVRQTVDFVRGDRPYTIRARLQTDFGGVIGHKIRVWIRATGSGPDKSAEKTKALDITNHYKVVVAGIGLPAGTEHIEVLVELMPRPGASKCKMVADTVKLVLFRP